MMVSIVSFPLQYGNDQSHQKVYFLLGLDQSRSGEKYGWDFSLREAKPRVRKKKIPHESQMAHFKLPMNGLAGLMK